MINAHMGEDIHLFAGRMIEQAKREGTLLRCQHNGAVFIVRPTSDPSDIVAIWDLTRRLESIRLHYAKLKELHDLL